MATITISEVSGTELYHRYPGQTSAQDCYVYLDCETGALSAEASPEVGNAVPMRQWHGHVQAWSIPALKGPAATALLEAIAPLAQHVCDGYESVWDGRNHVARFDADATAACEEIAALCERYDGEDEDAAVNAWEAGDWLGGIGGRDAQRAVLGVTAATTDEDLEALATRLTEEAEGEGVDELEGLDRYLTGLRDEAAAAEDE